MKSSKIKRRKFLKTALAAAAGTSLAGCSRNRSSWRFLTEPEARTLDAICEQLIPGDKDAGASRAGVVNFIDLQLVGFHRRHQNAYRAGLAALDQTSRARFGSEFAALEGARQQQLLLAMEKNEVTGNLWKAVPARQFFELVLNHTMQGFYGDPRHGGNREAASWRMLGVPYPPVRGRGAFDFPG